VAHPKRPLTAHAPAAALAALLPSPLPRGRPCICVKQVSWIPKWSCSHSFTSPYVLRQSCIHAQSHVGRCTSESGTRLLPAQLSAYRAC